MFVSIVTVPIYLHLIGPAQYGVLAIVWMFLGYFGVFDPGLSRATAYSVARLKDEARLERQKVFWTAVTINATLGLLGGLALYFVARPVFGHFFKMPDDLRGHVMAGLPWLAAAVPVGTVVGIFSGTLEGLRKFALINTVNFFGTLAFQVIPLIIAFFHNKDLSLIIAATVLVRLGTGLVYSGFACFYCKSGLPRLASLSVAKELLSYGSWISISNLIVPVLSTLDKVLIGTYLGAAQVTMYTIPENLTRRFSIIPGALSRSIFPKISSEVGFRSKSTLLESFEVLLAVMTPVCVAGILGMHIFLQLWIGRDFAAQAFPVAVILLLGIFLNSLAYLPSTYLQATGRPNVNAKIHLIDIIPHIIMMFLGVYYYHIVGAAMAMLFVSALDTALLFWFARFEIWRIRSVQMAVFFLCLAVVGCILVPYDLWTSYVGFSIFNLVCLVYFVRTVPKLAFKLSLIVPSPFRHLKV